jgi:hypothetical protein
VASSQLGMIRCTYFSQSSPYVVLRLEASYKLSFLSSHHHNFFAVTAFHTFSDKLVVLRLSDFRSTYIYATLIRIVVVDLYLAW